MENGFALILSELKKLKSAYELQFNSLSNQEDLTQIELTILGFLLNNTTFNTAKDIEEVHVLKKSNISNAIDHLIVRGYLTRNRDIQDRRIIHLEITEKGLAIATEIKEIQKNFFTILFYHIEFHSFHLFYIIKSFLNFLIMSAFVLYELCKLL